MLINKKGTSIVEAIIVMVIVVVGVVGMYNIYSSSQKLSNSSINRLQAISIAREGIEAMTNIRDTNWMLFGANTNNCWDTLNYNSTCVTSDVNIPSSSYIIYKNNDNRWEISTKTTGSYSSSTYRNRFKVMTDNNGLYTQTGSFTDTNPLFTREIKIENLGQQMNIESIVRWTDSSKNSGNHEVKLETTLTNWKK